jgi:hypothetical protein
MPNSANILKTAKIASKKDNMGWREKQEPLSPSAPTFAAHLLDRSRLESVAVHNLKDVKALLACCL